MITKVLKTQTGKLKVTIPTTLNELTMGTLIALENNSNLNIIDEIAILSGIDKDELNSIKLANDLQVFADYLLSLAHQLKYTYNEKSIPETVMFGTVKVNVIKNLSMEPAGAFMAAKDIMVDEINNHINIYGNEDNWEKNIKPSPKGCAMILAHYFYCRVTGLVYNETKAEQFVDEIYKLPVQVAMPIARYFFLKFPNLLRQKITLWQAVKQKLREKQVSRRLKSSNTSTR